MVEDFHFLIFNTYYKTSVLEAFGIILRRSNRSVEPHGQFSPTRALAWTSDFDQATNYFNGKRRALSGKCFWNKRTSTDKANNKTSTHT